MCMRVHRCTALIRTSARYCVAPLCCTRAAVDRKAFSTFYLKNVCNCTGCASSQIFVRRTNSPTKHRTQEHWCHHPWICKITGTTCMETLNHDLRQHSVIEVALRCSSLRVVDHPKYRSPRGPRVHLATTDIRRTGLPPRLSPQGRYIMPKKILGSRPTL